MLQQLKTIVGAMTSTLVVLGIIVYVARGTTHDVATAPPVWLVAGQLAAGAAVFALCEAIGYRTPAIAPGTEPEAALRISGQALNATTILRAALCESIALISLAAAFVIPHGGVIGYGVGAVVSILLLLVQAWPGRRVLEKTAASLERDGGRSGLRELTGSMPQGPIQEF